MSATVVQETDFDLQTHSVNIPASSLRKQPHPYAQQEIIQNSKKPFKILASTRNRYSSSQIRRKSRRRGSAEPTYVTSLGPNEYYPSPLLSTSQNMVNRSECLRP